MLYYPIAYGHNSFAFNSHLDAAGAAIKANLRDSFIVDEVLENPAYRDLRDPYHLTEGGQLGRVHKGMHVKQLSGRLQTPETSQPTRRARMSDRARAFRAAFDPAICYRDSPTTDGAYALQWTEDTQDSANYPALVIPMQMWMRPVQQPFLGERLAEGGWRQWRVALLAADPRAYEQTERTLSLSPGTASGNAINRGTEAAPLKAVITMAGAGATNFTITRGGVAFILNLSTMVNLDVVSVIMATSAPYGRGRYITKNSVENATLKTSAPSTWLDVPVGTTSFAITNTTNVTTCVLSWYSAWA